MILGCFSAVQASVWHSLFPIFPSVRPLHRMLVTGRERNSLLVLFLPLLVVLELFGDPLSLTSV